MRQVRPSETLPPFLDLGNFDLKNPSLVLKNHEGPSTKVVQGTAPNESGPSMQAMKPCLFDALSHGQKCRLHLLFRFGVPSVMLQMVALCFLAGLIDGNFAFDSVEFFAGHAHLLI